MRPTPIPDREIWQGAIRRVIMPPDGDLTNPRIAPIEALIDRSPLTGAVNLSVRYELEDGDLDKLGAGGTVWLTFWGVIVPFATTVVGPVEEPPAAEPAPDLREQLVELVTSWTEATCQTDGAPCSWHRVSADCAAELRAVLDAHQ